jgi:PKD domain
MRGWVAIVVLTALLGAAAPAGAQWLPPDDLAAADPPNVDAGAPALAVAPDGTALVAFVGADRRVAVAIAPPGAPFGAPVPVSPPGQIAFGPAMAVDRAGNATLAWYDVPDKSIQTRSRPAGGDWGATDTLQPAGAAFDGPSLAVAANGAAAIAWGRTTTDPAVQVRAAVRLPGGGFGAGLTASPDAGTGLCGDPRVAVDDAGDVAALWTRRTTATGGYHVESAVKPAAAPAFAASEPRSMTTADSPCGIGLAMTADGRVTAMWDFGGGAPYVAYADRGVPFATGAWSGETKLSAPADAARHPTFALDDRGETLATWLDTGVLQSAVRAGTGPFGASRPLSGATDTKGQAVAAAPGGGSALAAFVGMSNGNDAVFASSRADGAFGDPVAVATTPPGGARVDLDSPALGLDDQGNGFAAWRATLFPNAATVIRVARFDPVPPAITAASVPGSALVGQAVGMSAAATDRMTGAALRFEFGDGSGADGGSAAHVYTAPGAYTVTIAATDGAGNRSATTRAIQVAAPPPPPPGRLLTVASLSWDRLPDGSTRLRKLVVEGLAGPETVRLSCKGQGCRRGANRTSRRHGRKLVLTKYVRGMVLRPKARLTIATTRPGFIPRTITYTMVKHRDPRKAVRCRPPGAKRSRAC